VSVAPSATTALTRDTVLDLEAAGVSAMSLSLDGPDPARHDGLRGVLGCFGWTLATAARITAAGIPLQINTLVSTETMPHLEAIGELVRTLGAARWSLFLLVPVGRGRALGQLRPRDCELMLDWVARTSRRWPFTLTTTEAPHYRRVVIQRLQAAGQTAADIRAHPVARGFGIRDGNGILFIAANGDVTPSGFLPLTVGNVREDDVLALYRDAPLFRRLRSPREFAGRCGACAFGVVCGSRARAWAATGDPLQEDPLCTWQPEAPPVSATA
jgi:MoaA/NifB/PqqE/SkfB family radical SAM enzyme